MWRLLVIRRRHPYSIQIIRHSEAPGLDNIWSLAGVDLLTGELEKHRSQLRPILARGRVVLAQKLE